jgi:diguanylate cyclase (GGDEF)-like protein
LLSIRRHLDGLKRTQDGAVLYSLIERGLKRFGETGKIEQAFASFLNGLLERYAKDPKYDAATRIKARFIQQRLLLHLRAEASGSAKTLESVTAAGPAATSTAAVPPSPPATALLRPGAPAVSTAEKEPRPAPPTVDKPAFRPAEAAPPDDRSKLEELEEALVGQVTETIATPGEWDKLTQGGEQALTNLDRSLGDFGDLKQILTRGLDELIRERRSLIQKLEGAGEYLRALETDRRRLQGELGKVRKHSLADELTGLPKREVFVRSLEAEIGRVKRYGFAFALALLDVDGLETVNRNYGREAGDSVLRCYAGEILSRFRTYDLVARYGEDEFAVLFPNTQKEGALRALEKAQKNVASTYINHDGKSFRLPSFSSVLTMYAQGEKAATLLTRAAEALDNAKLRGKSQMVVSLPSS